MEMANSFRKFHYIMLFLLLSGCSEDDGNSYLITGNLTPEQEEESVLEDEPEEAQGAKKVAVPRAPP